MSWQPFLTEAQGSALIDQETGLTGVPQSPLNILCINWHSGMEDHVLTAGGARRARQLLKGLISRGHLVTLLDVEPTLLTHAEARVIGTRIHDGLRDAGTLQRVCGTLSSAARLGLQVKRRRKHDHDLVYVPCAELPAALILGLLAARMLKVPIVACPLTIVSWEERRAARHRLVKGAVLRLLKRCELCVVIHPEVARYLSERGFSGRVAVGLTGVDQPLMTIRSGSSSPGRHPAFLYVGRVVPEKGLVDLVRAFARVHRTYGNATLTIAGSGPVQFVTALRGIAADLRIDHSVDFVGCISEEEKWQRYGEADIFVSPSRMEHFGIAIREALRMGTPCVVYELPALRDLRESSAVRQARLNSIDDLAEQMTRLVGDVLTHGAVLRASAQDIRHVSWEEATLVEEALLRSVVPKRDYSPNGRLRAAERRSGG